MTALTIDEFNKLFDKRFNYVTEYITPISDDDKELFLSYSKETYFKSSTNFCLNFENSFEYIRMYFNSGGYQGFKFYDDEDLILFALEKPKKPHFKLFKPLGPNVFEKIPNIIAMLNTLNDYPIQTVCLDNLILQAFRDVQQIKVKNIKSFNYYIYNLDNLNNLTGNAWKNVRQKINTFKKKYPVDKLKIEPLNLDNFEDVIHFIGVWRRELLSNRGFSYANLEKNKFAAKYYADKIDNKNIWGMVYIFRNRIIAFQLLYRLGSDSAAHAIGISDSAITGLSEFTQIHIWQHVQDCGIRFINDGPSWRSGLDKYKQKFNPVAAQQVFECKIKNIDQ